MTAPNVPSAATPQSNPRALVRSTVMVVVIAIILAVTVVLPAERGIDPLGVGRLLGLTEMGEIKTRLAREAALDEADAAAADSSATAADSTR